MNHSDSMYDFMGAGFGPSNMALAVALKEADSPAKQHLKHCFIEKQDTFQWHGGMLLDNTNMQISFMKDLATIRNPTSRFTFLNYLSEQGRLEDFINLKTFYPSRQEFNDYLSWVAGQFDQQCHYGESVTAIKPVVENNQVIAVEAHSTTSQGQAVVRRGRNLVLGIGGRPNVPEVFEHLDTDRILHSSQYLKKIGQAKALLGREPRIAVIGGGQSAAEIYLNLANTLPDSSLNMIVRAGSLKPADSSPFVNEIFHTHFINDMYSRTEEDRQKHLRDYQDTNYAVVDDEELQQLQALFYQQKLTGVAPHRLSNHTNVIDAKMNGDCIDLLLENKAAGEHQTESFDLVILATGYRRDVHKKVLSGLSDYLDDYQVDRNYRLQTPEHFLPGIYLQGYCEASHGLSDTLLSVLAVRSEEILNSMVQHMQHPTDLRTIRALA